MSVIDRRIDGIMEAGVSTIPGRTARVGQTQTHINALDSLGRLIDRLQKSLLLLSYLTFTIHPHSFYRDEPILPLESVPMLYIQPFDDWMIIKRRTINWVVVR